MDENGRKCAEQEKFAEKSEIVKMANNLNKLYKMRIKKHSLCKIKSYVKTNCLHKNLNMQKSETNGEIL